MGKPQDNYRTELKYVFDREHYFILKRCLIGARFDRAHPGNLVNNIYFDYNKVNYQDNIDGWAIRKKARIRWYNDFEHKCVLEEKIKIGMAGTKNRYSVYINDIEDVDELRKVYISATGDRRSRPITRNRYLREYFINNGVRITLDSNIRYSRPDSKFFIQEPQNIMEIKFENDQQPDLSFINDLIPLKYTKYSKYQQSIEMLRIP